MAELGPRKIVPPKSPKQAALEVLNKDLTLLNRQRDVLGRIIQEMLQGYDNVSRRVKASGDADLAVNSLNHLYRLSRLYRHMSGMPSVTPQETKALWDEEQAVLRMADHLHNTHAKVSSLMKKLAADFQMLQRLKQELEKMTNLKVDAESFFQPVGRAEVVRREAKAKA